MHPTLGGIIANIGGPRREDVQKCFDEVTHVELPAKLVREARAEGLEYFNTLPVWRVVKTQECWDATGRPPISTKWVDVNKGDQNDYGIRCRLVAREMGGAKSDEFYAPTPPLEAKRLLFSEAATNRIFGKHEKKLLFIDVRKAYFNAEVDRPTFVEVPPRNAVAWLLRPTAQVHVRHQECCHEVGRHLHTGARQTGHCPRPSITMLFYPQDA